MPLHTEDKLTAAHSAWAKGPKGRSCIVSPGDKRTAQWKQAAKDCAKLMEPYTPAEQQKILSQLGVALGLGPDGQYRGEQHVNLSPLAKLEDEDAG